MMTRDERMGKLLDCVNYYAESSDGGRRARNVLAEIAKDEVYQGLLKEQKNPPA
jgi:hypothetical protein